MQEAATLKRTLFGRLPSGEKVEAITLANGCGMQACVITFGAALQSVLAPDRHGLVADVVLGHERLIPYFTKPQYFGATVGRYANRIANGRFCLDGEIYQLDTNERGNTLHGGSAAFDRRTWRVLNTECEAAVASVTLGMTSDDGDMGFPGNLETSVTYSLDARNLLTVDYRATTDRPTIVNLSNHTFWNLGGDGSGSVMQHELEIAADTFTPVDLNMIPTGEYVDVTDTACDFRTAKPIGKDIRRATEPQLLIGQGYDLNWVINGQADQPPRRAASVRDPASGRVMTLYSNQPGLQFYSGNRLDGTTIGKGQRIYRQSDGFALEPQRHPDTPNRPQFGSARLQPGETYRNVLIYAFSNDSGAAEPLPAGAS